MPFQSEKQRRYLHANHPEIAKRWERDYGEGGILNINASEEIIDDDGNDIELTAYNAAFDDPNDLSTGVKTLFQAKDGGIPQLAKKSNDGSRPGYGGPQDWGQQEEAEKQAAKTGTAGSEGTGGYAGKSQAEMQSLSQVSPSHGGMDTAWSQSQEYKNAGYTAPGFDTAQKVKTSNEWMEEEIIKVIKLKDLNKEQKVRHLKHIWDEGKKAWKTAKDLKTAFGLHPVVGVIAALFMGSKAKKEREEEIRLLEVKLGHLEDWDLKTRHHTADTPYQILEQRILNLQQRKKKEEEQRDRPEQIEVVPIGEEIEAYEDVYAMSPWERIKANQAKRALLVDKGIIQENPIVDESVTDITLQANSGGLANLFRVKNQ
jgi:hypothetical protein